MQKAAKGKGAKERANKLAESEGRKWKRPRKQDKAMEKTKKAPERVGARRKADGVTSEREY